MTRDPLNRIRAALLALGLTLHPLSVAAVDVAQRISDREIIESLAELKAGQKALEAKMDQRFEAMEKRNDARFEAVDQRFEALDRQFTRIWSLMLVVIAGIFGLIGFIIWDRKTAMKPVEARLQALEAEFHRDLELSHEDGSRLTRLVKVLRELARTDEKLARVLRSFSLL